jgi:diguanylate cyclase (GGDEF)-like protein
LLEDYPIYVSVAIGVDDALAVWRRQTMIAAMLVAVVLIGFGILLTRLWRTELRRALSLEELAQSEEKVRELAYFDPLTNLPNRRFLLDRLALGLSQAKRHQRSLALMFLDLDHFKTINDTLGHVVGDELLKEIARRLVECIRTGDTISRQGGDEFVILLTEISHPSDASNVAEKIIKALGRPYHVSGHEFKATISIGIAVYPVDGTDDAPELMRKADKAMYAVKATGGNGYRFFSD